MLRASAGWLLASSRFNAGCQLALLSTIRHYLVSIILALKRRHQPVTSSAIESHRVFIGCSFECLFRCSSWCSFWCSLNPHWIFIGCSLATLQVRRLASIQRIPTESPDRSIYQIHILGRYSTWFSDEELSLSLFLWSSKWSKTIIICQPMTRITCSYYHLKSEWCFFAVLTSAVSYCSHHPDRSVWPPSWWH